MCACVSVRERERERNRQRQNRPDYESLVVTREARFLKSTNNQRDIVAQNPIRSKSKKKIKKRQVTNHSKSLKTLVLILSFYFDFFKVLNKTCFEKANARH